LTHFLGNFFNRARTLDPATSHEAAASVKQIAPIHMQIIHDALHEHGPMGKDQISLWTKLDGNQIARRLPEMKKMGLVELTGKTVHSASGRQEREWRAL
jgi:hypothetical protein